MLISGATVLIAMAGMLFAGSNVFTSLGIGAMIVVFVSMIGSLTVLPAVLARLGDRIDRGVLAVSPPASPASWALRWEPGLPRAAGDAPHAAAAPERRAAGVANLGGDAAAVAALPGRRRRALDGLLVLLTLPAFGMHTKLPGFNDLPHEPEDRADLRPDRAGVPGVALPRDGGRESGRRDVAGRNRSDRRPKAPGARVGRHEGADPDDGERSAYGREGERSARRQR